MCAIDQNKIRLIVSLIDLRHAALASPSILFSSSAATMVATRDSLASNHSTKKGFPKEVHWLAVYKKAFSYIWTAKRRVDGLGRGREREYKEQDQRRRSV